MLSLTLRAWTRYLAPLTAISALAFAAVAIALRIAHGVASIALLDFSSPPPPAANAAIDPALIHAQLREVWVIAAGAWIVQLALAGAAMPAVRGILHGAPLTQARAALDGGRGLLRALIPTAIAVLAVLVGGVALVVPGVLLFGLFALTGAAAESGLPPPAPLIASAAAARARTGAVIAAIAAMLAIDLAIAFAIGTVYAHAVPPKPTVESLAHVHVAIRATALAIAAVSPLPACAFAAIFVSASPRR